MAFTWKPLESRRAHTLSTSLWHGMELAAILFATAGRKKKRTSCGMRQEHWARTGSYSQRGDVDCDWTTQ